MIFKDDGVAITKDAGAAYFDQRFSLSEKEILKSYIDDEVKKGGYNLNNIAIVKKRKLLFTIIFSVLSCILISLIFFHISNVIILLEIINIIIYVMFMIKYDAYKYIIKQIKARPNEDISNIIVSLLSEQATYKFSLVAIPLIVLSCCLPLFIFREPMMFFEKSDESGYHLRFYTMGLTNNKEVVVPGEYKGEPVTGIRGNVFANIASLEKVTLPDSITTIRGRVFKNDKNLVSVNLPKNLTYLGGSAFKDCKSLTSIVIPEGVTVIDGATFEGCSSLKEVVLPNTLEQIAGEAFKECTSLVNITIPDMVSYIGGEAFMNCSALESINLPSLITEVRGSTFEGCSSLQSIVIPDGVTRIGGSAFRYCSSLSSVSMPFSITEIGSSAFRECTSLRSINVPSSAYVNERAFKDTPVSITYLNEGGTVLESVTESEDGVWYGY